MSATFVDVTFYHNIFTDSEQLLFEKEKKKLIIKRNCYSQSAVIYCGRTIFCVVSCIDITVYQYIDIRITKQKRKEMHDKWNDCEHLC